MQHPESAANDRHVFGRNSPEATTFPREERPMRFAPMGEHSGLETERHFVRRRRRDAARERENAAEKFVRVHQAKTICKVSAGRSIFFNFARARKARTLIAARLQPVRAWISSTDRSSRC